MRSGAHPATFSRAELLSEAPPQAVEATAVLVAAELRVDSRTSKVESGT